MTTSQADPLEGFSQATRMWFRASFEAPTAAQMQAWQAAAAGGAVLVSAPTGSGKTLAAFLAALDRLLTSPEPSGPRRVRVLYVSPLKALAYDVDRNLRAPLVGIQRAAERLGQAVPAVHVALRTGDTPADERRRLARHPPDILITTPESLYLLLTSRAREMLTGVETVIVDEVHAVAGTKRGAHLALSLERLEALQSGGAPQRIGLSATQRPLDEVARFLGGGTPGEDGAWVHRPVRVVDISRARSASHDVGATKELDVEIVVPVEDMSRLGEVLPEPASGPAAAAGELRRSIWPAVHPRLLELVRAHRSTIIFANSRRLAERLCTRLNELASQDLAEDEAEVRIARAHHGSVSREQRLSIEEDLKAGRLPCVVATSSLELGIDMGAVDLVIQVESPGAVSRGLQRIGRAGHQVGAPSVGKVFPKYRGDLVECAVVVERMERGAIETTRYPRNPLDVLAQQIVAMAAMDPWTVTALHATLRGAANFAELSRAQLDGVLDMLSGRYPSDEFAELRPRLNWDRVADRITGRPGAQRLAVTSGGTIPDRGLYGVFIAGDGPGRRVGELDEEMVYETRAGEVFTLGSTAWRIEEITRDQVLVTPAPGEIGQVPFWHGDAPGRPVELGRAVGRFVREIGEAQPERALERLRGEYGLDEWAATNLLAYLAEQAEATGALPSDRTIVVERFRDEIGDWRVVVLSPFGAQVHAPWALAIQQRARDKLGMDVQTMHADDGIVVRLPDMGAWNGSMTAEDAPPADLVLVDPDDVEQLVIDQLADSALFASHFRESAARALLLPRRRPGGRTPLWQQRQRSADLLRVAGRYGSFPILLETYRECLRDVFDVPALVELLRGVQTRRVRVAQVETGLASPFAASLLFDYVAGYMYEGDAPLAERRAQALSLDRELLAELVGSEELRDLIDADALAQLEAELQRLDPERHARSVDAVHDLLREIGDLRDDEAEARIDGPAEAWLAQLAGERRVYRARVAGEERWAAAEDAARLRDGLGVPPAGGLPAAFLEPVQRPLVDLVARYARTHGPFTAGECAARLGLPVDPVELALAELDREGRATAGEFRPGGAQREWCDAEVLRRVRRRSLAVLRREVEAVEPATVARFLPAWQQVGVGHPDRAAGTNRTFEVVEQLQGAPVPASVLENDVLPVRLPRYNPAWLDELFAAGDLVWVGRGALGSGDGKVSLYLREQAPLLAPPPRDVTRDEWFGERHASVLAHLEQRGASFWNQLYLAMGGGDVAAGVEALWDLVWAGVVTNDTFGVLRQLTGTTGRTTRPGPGRGRRPRMPTRSGPPRTSGRWSLVSELLPGLSPTERATALATQLLDRHGVLVRDALGAEEVPGGFSTVYGVLRAMEESGRARRGYFVEGLGGAQFALPGAIDRLRSLREAGMDATVAQPLVLAATDPANPFGAALPWPQPRGDHRHAPRRVAGAEVVVRDGHLVLYVEKGGRSLLTFTGDPSELAAAAGALTALPARGHPLQLARVDGQELDSQPVLEHLRAAGFADHPRGLVLRTATAASRRAAGA